MEHQSCRLLAYSGEPNSGTSRTATNLTTTNANNLLVNFWVNWDNPATHTAATNWTLRSGAGATTVGMTDQHRIFHRNLSLS